VLSCEELAVVKSTGSSPVSDSEGAVESEAPLEVGSQESQDIKR